MHPGAGYSRGGGRAGPPRYLPFPVRATRTAPGWVALVGTNEPSPYPVGSFTRSEVVAWRAGDGAGVGPVMGLVTGLVMWLVAGLVADRGAHLRAQPGAGDGAPPRISKIFLLPAPQGVARDLAPAMPARVRADTGGGGRCRGTVGPADTLASPASWRTGRGVGGGMLVIGKSNHQRAVADSTAWVARPFPPVQGARPLLALRGGALWAPSPSPCLICPSRAALEGPGAPPSRERSEGSTARRPRSGSKGRPRPVPAGE
jgi:hypothetical protein